jgi:hypothetical protein
MVRADLDIQYCYYCRAASANKQCCGPHHVDADPIRILFVAMMRIRILFVTLMRIRILVVTLMRIRIPGPTFHFDADPDPSFQIKAQKLEKCSNRFIFRTVQYGLSSAN